MVYLNKVVRLGFFEEHISFFEVSGKRKKVFNHEAIVKHSIISSSVHQYFRKKTVLRP